MGLLFIESFLTRFYLWKLQKHDTRDLGPCFCRVKTASARGKYRFSFPARVTFQYEHPVGLWVRPDCKVGLAYLNQEFKNKKAKLQIRPLSASTWKKGSDLIVFSAILIKKKRGWLTFALERGGPDKLFWNIT